jgi:hypothetical protein
MEPTELITELLKKVHGISPERRKTGKCSTFMESIMSNTRMNVNIDITGSSQVQA